MLKLKFKNIEKWLNQLNQESHLSDEARFEADTSMKALMSVMIMFSIIIFSLLIWSAFVDVEETAVAQGEIVTRIPVQTIQHLEGGIIKEIVVKNGDEVKLGDTLLKLDTTGFQAELEEMQMRQVSLLFDAERLRAYTKGQELPLREILQRTIAKLSPKARSEIQGMLDEEEILLRIQRASQSDQKSILEVQLSQNLEDLIQLKKQRDIVGKQIKLLEEERDMYTNLRKKEYFSQRDYLRVRREVNQAHGDLENLMSEIKKGEQKYEQTRRQLNELSSNLSKNAAAELGKITSELLEVKHKIEKLEDKVKRTDVKATIQGTIQGMEVVQGSVLAPGQQIMKIIPKNTALIARVQISPKDRGHINIGDSVNLKISTYDFPRYGAVPGRLSSISASTFKNQQTPHPFYVGEIDMLQQHIGPNPELYPLLPGMTVTADIVTGKKTLLAYLLKPIHLTLMSSFRER